METSGANVRLYFCHDLAFGLTGYRPEDAQRRAQDGSLP
jgi:hypothetical protein